MKKLLLTAVLASISIGAIAQLGKVEDVKKSLQTTNKDTVAWDYGGVLNLGGNEDQVANSISGFSAHRFSWN